MTRIIKQFKVVVVDDEGPIIVKMYEDGEIIVTHMHAKTYEKLNTMWNNFSDLTFGQFVVKMFCE